MADYTHIANPVKVLAFKIVDVGPKHTDGSVPLCLSNGENMLAGCEMLARYHPKPDDYWVEQEDGYVYLNPKAVFERKYRPVEETVNAR